MDEETVVDGMKWVPGAELEDDEEAEERLCEDQCDYCRAPAGMPHHVDCPEE